MAKEAADRKGGSDEAAQSSPASFLRTRVGLAQIVGVGVIAALAAGALYYASSAARESAFKDARAFRVLEDVVAQFRNLEESRATLLKWMPKEYRGVAPECNGTHASDAAQPAAVLAMEDYLSHLDLVEAKLCQRPQQSAAAASPTSSRAARVADNFCATTDPGEIAIAASVDDGRIMTLNCGVDDDPHLVLQEPFDRVAARFISQDFFDEVLLALRNGTVVGEFPARAPDSATNLVQIHAAIAERLNVLGVQGLIDPPKPETQDSKDEAAAAARAAPNETRGLVPMAFDKTVGGQRYRVFVQPFRNPYRLFTPRMQRAQGTGMPGMAAGDSSSAPSAQSSGTASSQNDGIPERYLYVVGLQRVAVSEEIVASIRPYGLWALVVLISLNLVAWPLISLAFGSREESFTPVKVAGCAAGLILVPAILAIAATSLWSTFELESGMRERARMQAEDIAKNLRTRLLDTAQILHSFAPIYAPLAPHGAPPPVCPRTEDGDKGPPLDIVGLPPVSARVATGTALPFIALEANGNKRFACDADTRYYGCRPAHVQACNAGPGVVHWSPFRNIAGVNRNGLPFGPLFSVFDTNAVSRTLDLSGREYFQALRNGQPWSLKHNDGSGRRELLVAQRLFNKSDASKTLQVAVPLCDPATEGADSDFCGVVTGDVRMLSLIASVSSPLIRFAVIDTATGTVIFHSNDNRSLAENFFRESENNPTLRAAIRSHSPAPFTGRYLGDAHSFFYQPIEDVPWGVVTFYSQKELGDLPFRAGCAALAAYAGSVLALSLIGLVVIWIVSLRDRRFTIRKFARTFWPRVPLGPWQGWAGRYHPALLGMVVIVLAMLLGWARWSTLAVAALITALSLWIGRSQAPAAKPHVSQRGSVRAYVRFLTGLLTITSIVVGCGLFLVFHRLQMNALVRDGLVQSAYQLQRRFNVAQKDLRRLVPPDGQKWDKFGRHYPSAWDLMLVPNLGFSGHEQDLPRALSVAQSSQDELREAPAASVFERLVWNMIAGSASQEALQAVATLPAHAPVGSSDQPGESAIRCGLFAKDDACIVNTFDGGALLLRTTPAQFSQLSEQRDSGWAWPRICALIAVFGLVLALTQLLARLFVTRLLGLGASYARARPGRKPSPITSNPEAFKSWWDGLSPSERLALYQMACGQLVNPRNAASIEKLLVQGWIRVDPWPMPRTGQLARLIRNAESAEQFAAWKSGAAQGPWNAVRIPLFILLMVLIAWLSWAAGGSMRALSAVLVATVAFFGQIAQVVNLARGGGSGAPKGS